MCISGVHAKTAAGSVDVRSMIHSAILAEIRERSPYPTNITADIARSKDCKARDEATYRYAVYRSDLEAAWAFASVVGSTRHVHRATDY